MSVTYLCALPLPDEWFAALAARVDGVEIHRIDPAGAPDPGMLERVELLHTGAWLPDIAAMPALRAVQLDTSGVDHVRSTTLWSSAVPIATLGGVAPVVMGEYALMAILALAHRLPAIAELRSAQRWPSDAQRLAVLTPRAVRGSTVGIIGYGRIGREIGRLASAFGMEIIGVSRTGAVDACGTGDRFDSGHIVDAAGTEIVAVERLAEVLPRCSTLVVVVPLTPQTRGLLSAEQLDLLPVGALVVDISRGGVVDEAALLERLRDGRIGGVARDVFDAEPLPADSPWWTEPGAIVTPHVAGLTSRYLDHTLALVAENLTRMAAGRSLINVVDRASGY